MNTLAYFFFHSARLDAPLVWIINILIVCVVALILWQIIQWVASEFGVPAKIIHLIGLLIFLGLVLTLFAGCQQSEIDAWTRAGQGAVSGYYERPAPVYQQPTIYVAP